MAVQIETSDSPRAEKTMPRPIVVTMLGAGSFFTGSILRDVLTIPGNVGGELRLVDVDAERLELSAKWIQLLVTAHGSAHLWNVKWSTDRATLLEGTDYIVNAIEVSGLACVRIDNDLPLEYGISQCIGDTIGPGGLFKAFRTVPVWLEILRDVERLCPNAWVLNYTNPMNMMCLAAARTSKAKVVGLCHSVQGTSRLLAEFADVPYDEMNWACAGINHLAWFTRLEHRGQDLYPRLKARAADAKDEMFEREPVRCDMMLHFGAFITESSGHLSEYLPYYRKRKELRERYLRSGYRGEESFYADNWPNWRAGQDREREAQLSGEKPIEFRRSHEYGAAIIEAVEKNQPIVIHGNVSNRGGLIENLPNDGCVEVACLVDGNGVQPTNFGNLPRQMAAICALDMLCFDLGAEAAIHRSKELATQAMMLDPLTAAVCSPGEIRELCVRMFDAQGQYLPGFS